MHELAHLLSLPLSDICVGLLENIQVVIWRWLLPYLIEPDETLVVPEKSVKLIFKVFAGFKVYKM